MVKLKHGKALLNLGGMFFVVQVGAAVLFSTYNVFISHLFDAEEVVIFLALHLLIFSCQSWVTQSLWRQSGARLPTRTRKAISNGLMHL